MVSSCFVLFLSEHTFSRVLNLYLLYYHAVSTWVSVFIIFEKNNRIFYPSVINSDETKCFLTSSYSVWNMGRSWPSFISVHLFPNNIIFKNANAKMKMSFCTQEVLVFMVGSFNHEFSIILQSHWSTYLVTLPVHLVLCDVLLYQGVSPSGSVIQIAITLKYFS